MADAKEPSVWFDMHQQLDYLHATLLKLQDSRCYCMISKAHELVRCMKKHNLKCATPVITVEDQYVVFTWKFKVPDSAHVSRWHQVEICCLGVNIRDSGNDDDATIWFSIEGAVAHMRNFDMDRITTPKETAPKKTR